MSSEYNYERTVDLVSFLKAVLVHWRQMFILGIIFALILGMVPILEYRAGDKKEHSRSGNEMTDESAGYLTAEEYNAALDRLDRIMAEKRQYVSHSFLMRIDPFNEAVARERIYVDVLLNSEELKELDELDTVVEITSLAGAGDDESTSGTSSSADSTQTEGGTEGEVNSAVQFFASRLMREYTMFLTGRVDWTELAAELGTEPKYIDECITVESYIDSAELILSVKCYDTETAVRIRDYAVEKLKEELGAVKEDICDHELRFMDEGVEILYDSGMRNYQENFISEYATTQTRYDNFKDAKSNYVYNAPTRASLNKKAILVNLIIGFIVGVLIGAMFNVILIFVKGRVISSKELLLSYDLKPLATLSFDEKKRLFSGIDRFIENLGMGSDGKLTYDERMLKAAQMVELYASDAGTIVLTGDVSESDLRSVTEKMQKNLKGISLKYCDTLFGNTSLLRESDGVILVEKKNESRLGRIETDIGIIGEMKIPVIGTILI